MPKRRTVDEESELGSAVGDESPTADSGADVRTVKARRAPRVAVDYTMAELMDPQTESAPTLYVPEKHRERILRMYGGWTVRDFDHMFGFNAKIGSPYNTSFQSMMYFMNATGGRGMRDQWQKVAHDPRLSDAFNLVQSMVRSRVGEEAWYD